MSNETNSGALGGIELEDGHVVGDVVQGSTTVPAEAPVKPASSQTVEESPEVAELKKKLAEAEAIIKARDEKPVQETPGVANSSRASSKERWAITLDEGRDENESSHVFVQVNGRAYNIQRGVVVHVPREVLSVLNDAVEHKAIPQKNAAGQPAGYTIRRARRFPYQNHGKSVDKHGNKLDVELPKVDNEF